MKKITLNPLDASSIEAAVAELKKLEEERKANIKKYIRRLAEIGAEAARNAYYGGSINPNKMPSNEEGLRISVEERDNGCAIVAQGSQVIFLEFGAGAWTESHELAGDLGIAIKPGSYSETEGAGTWGDWLDAELDPADYPYNRTPRMGMWEAYKAILAAQDKVAKEVFK